MIVDVDDRESPLYIPVERLVHTEESILSLHFVNGTLYIIRYPF